MEDNLEKYEELKKNQKIGDYIHEFEKCNRILKKKNKVTKGDLLSNITIPEKMLVFIRHKFCKKRV